jgi:hypothetical protein
MNDGVPPKTDIHAIADRLWDTADELRANSHLKAAEYAIPVLGLDLSEVRRQPLHADRDGA